MHLEGLSHRLLTVTEISIRRSILSYRDLQAEGLEHLAFSADGA